MMMLHSYERSANIELVAAMRDALEDPPALQKAHWTVLAALADQAWRTD